MKNYYFAVTAEVNEKYYSFVIQASTNDNLLSKFSDKRLLHVNICETRKAAVELVRFWDECHRKNGTYLFAR